MASSNRTDQLIQMNKGQKVDVDGAYLNLDWKLGGNYTVYSNTGFRKQKEHLPNTYTGAAPINTVTGQPSSLFDASRDTNRDTFQQEIRLASSLSGPFNYVAGAFYQRNDARFCVVQYLGFVDMTLDGQAIFGDQQFFNNNPQLACNKQKSNSIAGFVDGTYDVTDKFQLGAGARYTRDTKEWSGRTQIFWFALSPTPFPLSDLNEPLDAADFGKYTGGTIVNYTTPGFSNLKTTWSEPSWRLTGSYKFTPTVFGYATVSRGYKAGGYNDQTGSNGFFDSTLTRPVNPEFATNFELGLKSQWLDNRVRFNPTVFFVKYTDAQRAANIPAVKGGATFQETVFYNAAEITAKGVEIELQALVTESFLVRLAASHLDAKYDKFRIDQAQVGNPTIGDPDGNGIIETHLDLTGLPVPRSPKQSANISGTYTFGLANAGKLEATADVAYEDRNLYYISAAPPPVGYTAATSPYNAYLDSKTILNASLAWTSGNGKYFARV
jgi:iron complex outermembrane receptor protein